MSDGGSGWTPPGEPGGWGQGEQAQNPWATPQPGPPPGYGTPPPTYGAPPGYGAAPYGAGWQTQPQNKTSGLAIASLVVSLGGLFTVGFAGIVGFILGLVARSQIKKSGGQLGGNGMAIAGIVIGIIMFLGFIGFIVLIAAVGNNTSNDNNPYYSLAPLGALLHSAH